MQIYFFCVKRQAKKQLSERCQAKNDFLKDVERIWLLAPFRSVRVTQRNRRQGRVLWLDIVNKAHQKCINTFLISSMITVSWRLLCSKMWEMPKNFAKALWRVTSKQRYLNHAWYGRFLTIWIVFRNDSKFGQTCFLLSGVAIKTVISGLDPGFENWGKGYLKWAWSEGMSIRVWIYTYPVQLPTEQLSTLTFTHPDNFSHFFFFFFFVQLNQFAYVPYLIITG